MNRSWQHFHPAFRLQGRSFSGYGELLDYVRRYLPAHFPFLQQWFDERYEFIVHTSGSTGKPKELQPQKETAIHVARRSIDFFGVKPGERAVLNLSPEYIAGKMMWIRALTGGWELEVIPAAKELSLPPGRFGFGAMVPYQAYHNQEDLKRFDRLIIGGAPVDDDHIRRWQDLPTEIYETYGMTETLTHIAVRPLTSAARKRLGGTGKEEAFHCLPGIRVRLSDYGTLTICDPVVSEGPFVTNDLAEIIDETHFVWLGRRDFVINSGGHKIIPERLESQLRPYIRRPFYITAEPDPFLGRRCVMVVEMKPEPGYENGPYWQEIFEKAGLHPYERPRRVIYLPELPRTASGKIIREEF